MKPLSRLPALFTLLLLALLSSACTTPVKGLYHNESFNYPALLKGGIGVAGVVNGVNSHARWDDVERVRRADSLYRSMRDERNSLPIAPVSDLVQAIEPAAWAALLDNFRTTGALDLASHELMSAHYHRARYLVLARLERNEVSRDESEKETALTRYSEKLQKEVETGEIEVETKLTTTRSLSASFQILDLQDGGRVVWSGSISKSASDNNSREHVYEKHPRVKAALVDALVESLVNEPETPLEYPEPPPFDSLLARLFSGFAENLPEP